MRVRAALFVLGTVACGSSGNNPANDAGGVIDPGDSSAPPPNTSALGGAFAHGLNTGYWPPFTDVQTSQLGANAGSDSVRVKLPEGFFVQWGYDILVPTMKTRATYGMGNYTSWLCAPTQDHSTAPSNGNLEYYIPNNLYEPIFDGSGNVNANNYFASYVQQTISTYAPYIKVYSIWNEPDWVGDYNVVATWKTSPPAAKDLPRFNGSIFDYARMLRIAKTVAAKISPDVRIATGGLGYPEFLDALTRYSDDPNGGGISGDYPKAGIEYVDVLDLHYYPLYTPGNSDAATAGLLAHRDAFAKVLSDHSLPARPVVYTETGAPHVKVGSNPGGPDYARNYYVKSMVRAQAAGISGLQWFVLSDGASTSSDPYQSMGLYSNLSTAQTIPAATLTDTGVASTTLGTLTKNLAYDDAATKAVNAPANVTAVVLDSGNGSKRTLVAWATSTTADEDGSASLSLPFAANEMMWDFSKTQAKSAHAANDTVQLASDPRFFVEP
jgi:hypothetical protein